MNARLVCLRCRRPAVVCVCDRIPRLESRTRVCILRHPRERKVAVGTAHLAHLALRNSELHHGVDFADHPRVRELLAAPGTALLFPGPGAVSPEELTAAPPRALIVVDGTWSQARKLLRRNPALGTLPRIGFAPAQPSNYRIRRQPAADCVSTIEAIAHVLAALEGAPDRFAPLLAPFERMVDLQLAYEARGSPPRTRKRRNPMPRRDRALSELAARKADLVAVYAESNGDPPELVRLSATRLATGERFDALIAPRSPPAGDLAANLECPLERVLSGVALADAQRSFAAFLRAGDLLCGWGRYAEALLLAAGALAHPFADVRVVVSRHVGRRPAGVEQAVRLLGQPALPPPVAEGRAGRRLAALEAVLALLLAQDGAPAVPATQIA